MRSRVGGVASPVRKVVVFPLCFSGLLVLQWVLLPAAAIAQETEERSGVELTDLSPTKAMVLVILGTIGVGAVWFIPMLYDIHKSYRRQVDSWEALAAKYLEKSSDEPSLAELRLLLPQISKPPRGFPGLTRSLFAFTVLTIIAVSQLGLTFFDIAGAEDLRKTIVTSLLSVFASITGFYFGQRGAQHEDDPQPLPAPGPATVSVASPTPNQGDSPKTP
jgi:hypothetical protein